MNRGNIAVIGDVGIIYAVQTRQVPTAGQEALGGPMRTLPGGRGANQAIAAARLGAQATLIACVGADGYGTVLMETLKREGVNTECVSVDEEAPSDTYMTLCLPNHAITSVAAAGASQALGPSRIEEAAPAIERADLLLVQLAVPLPSVERAIQIAVDRGVPVLLDATPAWSRLPRLWRRADILIADQQACGGLVGVEVTDEHSAIAAAQKMRHRGVEIPVIAFGAEDGMRRSGCLAYREDETRLIGPYEAEVADPLGAADAFAAALGVWAAEGSDVFTAARYATAAAALSAGAPGGHSSLPSRRSVEEFVRRRGGVSANRARRA